MQNFLIPLIIFGSFMTEVGNISFNNSIEKITIPVSYATKKDVSEAGFSNFTSKNDSLEIASNTGTKNVIPMLSFENIKLNDNIRGVENIVSDAELKGIAQKGNCFYKFSDAESVAKNLKHDSAIVLKNNNYYIYSVSNDIALKSASGDNSFLDNSITAIIKSKKTFYNTGFSSITQIPNNNIAFLKNGKIMLEEKEFKIAGLNVYDLASVAQNQSDLESTLKLIASSGSTTVRFWAFSKHDPQVFKNIFDTSEKLGLNLKFIPVLGNQWKDMESSSSSFKKDYSWYKDGYKKEYLPHVLKTVDALINNEQVLMFELMNEPEANHQTLRNFVDDVSTKIREEYSDYEKETGKTIPRHLISIGLLGGKDRIGMAKEEFKALHILPNVDVVTAHDYSFDNGESSESDIPKLFGQYINYAHELNKPFFVGEIGVKVRDNGVENAPKNKKIRDNNKALQILNKKMELYKDQDISGVLLWGPQPLGHGVDGGGFGFTFKPGDQYENSLKNIFKVFK